MALLEIQRITVGYGETASMLAGRYGVPADALLRVNGLTSPGQVKQGTRLVIPVYSANATPPAGRAKTSRRGQATGENLQ